jgi:hypothetical protein
VLSGNERKITRSIIIWWREATWRREKEGKKRRGSRGDERIKKEMSEKDERRSASLSLSLTG